MSSPLCASPSVTRISVDNPSQATTVADLSSPSTGNSNASSGALSPLDPRSLNESVARTFKTALKPKPKQMLPRAQSAFTDEQTQNSLKYEQFQQQVEREKRLPAMEKEEKKSSIARTKSPQSLRRSVFVQLADDEYFKRFPCKKTLVDGRFEELPLFNASVGESAKSSYNRPITAHEIGDAIALFCLSDQEAVVHHYSSATKRIQDVTTRLSAFRRKERQYRIYIVGGDGSPESTQLLNNIYSALLLYFGNSGKIRETFLNKAAHSPFISVELTPQKEFFFCRHD